MLPPHINSNLLIKIKALVTDGIFQLCEDSSCKIQVVNGAVHQIECDSSSVLVGGADLVFTFRPQVVYFSNHRSIVPCTSPDGFCDKRFRSEVIMAVWQKLQSIADGV